MGSLHFLAPALALVMAALPALAQDDDPVAGDTASPPPEAETASPMADAESVAQKDPCPTLIERNARKEILSIVESVQLIQCFKAGQPGNPALPEGYMASNPGLGGYMTYQPPPDLFDPENLAPWSGTLEIEG